MNLSDIESIKKALQIYSNSFSLLFYSLNKVEFLFWYNI